MGTIQSASPELLEIKKQLTDIKVAIIAIKFPIKQMEELSANLVTGVALLKQPTENKVKHQHHIPKIILVTAVLFIILCLVCCGWYNTAQKLDIHRANDFKYRHLKLKNNPALHELLNDTDSLYENKPDFIKTVTNGEDSINRMVQKLIDEKEHDIKELKKTLQ